MDRESIIRAAAFPTDTVDAPELGGVLRVQGIPMGARDYADFVNRPIPVGDTGDLPQEDLVPHRTGASKQEKAAVDTANRIIRVTAGRRTMAPTEDERFRRLATGAFILGVIGDDGQRIFAWEDADTIRNTFNWNAVNRVAEKVWDLSKGASIEESKSDAPG